jgi:hypothetical protein
VDLRSLDGARLTFEQQQILKIVGPVTAALVGSLVIGVFAQWITRHAQDNLRNELITAMSEAAGRLYMACAHCSRVKDSIDPRDQASVAHLAKERGEG